MIADRSVSRPLKGTIKLKGRTHRDGNRTIYARRNGAIYNPHQVNDTTAFRPEMWAAEGVNILHEAMVYGGLVHRDFNNEVARYGQTVHTRKPGTFIGKRKQNDLDDVVAQDVTATDIEVKLNQRLYVSFVLGDADRSLSFQELISIYLYEAMQAQARLIDQSIAMQAYQFLGNLSGGLGALTKTNGHDYLLDMREVFNTNKTPMGNRRLGLASRSETILQKTELFKSAEQIGDAGTALRNAYLGRIAAWDTFLELNTPSVRTATVDTTVDAVTDGTADAGDTVITLDETTGLVTGQYVTIAGDLTPLRVTALGASPVTITTNRGLLRNVASGAAVTAYETALVNQSSNIAAGDTHLAASDGYPANWQKEIVYDGTGVPQVGQLVSFKLSGGTVLSQEYGIVQVDTDNNTILLDRPLDVAIDDNAIICLGPPGDYNFAFQREAVTLLNRPLALPESGTGSRAANGFSNSMSLRVEMSRDAVKQGTRVTIDALFGIKKLDDLRGGVLLG